VSPYFIILHGQAAFFTFLTPYPWIFPRGPALMLLPARRYNPALSPRPCLLRQMSPLQASPCLESCDSRGPTNPFILFSFAIQNPWPSFFSPPVTTIVSHLFLYLSWQQPPCLWYSYNCFAPVKSVAARLPFCVFFGCRDGVPDLPISSLGLIR